SADGQGTEPVAEDDRAVMFGGGAGGLGGPGGLGGVEAGVRVGAVPGVHGATAPEQRRRLVEQQPVGRIDGDGAVGATAVVREGTQPREDGLGGGAHRAERAFFSAAVRASASRSSSARTCAAISRSRTSHSGG